MAVQFEVNHAGVGDVEVHDNAGLSAWASGGGFQIGFWYHDDEVHG